MIVPWPLRKKHGQMPSSSPWWPWGGRDRSQLHFTVRTSKLREARWLTHRHLIIMDRVELTCCLITSCFSFGQMNLTLMFRLYWSHSKTTCQVEESTTYFVITSQLGASAEIWGQCPFFNVKFQDIGDLEVIDCRRSQGQSDPQEYGVRPYMVLVSTLAYWP